MDKKFSFGQNWKDYINVYNDSLLDSSIRDLLEWFSPDMIEDKEVLDAGCGSGLHSLAFLTLKAKHITSFDYDLKSIEASQYLWKKHNCPGNWQVLQGSVLDKNFLSKLGKFDIVYSWGVLHHTGSMWRAMINCMHLVKVNGFFLISIYVKGDNFQRDLERKKKYNESNKFGKRAMELYYFIIPLMIKRIRWGLNPFKWNKATIRGMNTYIDIKDWLGGLPYEVASVEEIHKIFSENNFKLLKFTENSEGYCNIYLFQNNGL
jgi:SAM-dependent methyltransferase